MPSERGKCRRLVESVWDWGADWHFLQKFPSPSAQVSAEDSSHTWGGAIRAARSLMLFASCAHFPEDADKGGGGGWGVCDYLFCKPLDMKCE